MSDRLKRQVNVELEQLNQLINTYRALLEHPAQTSPNNIELAALATMLHGFYTGVENIFKRIVVELGDTLPSSEFWHRDLLDQMTQITEHRQTVITPSLRSQLREYLGFRHVFRQAYAFQLKWEKMADLVQKIEPTLRMLETELAVFLQSLKS